MWTTAGNRYGADRRPDPASSTGSNASDEVYNGLRAQIVALDLPPGTVLSRSAIARQFGVSITPVRDALQRLDICGLVQVMPQSGTRVSLIDRQALFEAHFQRVALEGETVRRLSRRARKMSIAQAQDALDKYASLSSQVETASGSCTSAAVRAELTVQDHAFHAALFDGVGMAQVFNDLLERDAPFQRCRNLVSLTPYQHRMDVAFHRQILACLRAQDANGADATMRAHLADDQAVIGQAARSFPDYFV